MKTINVTRAFTLTDAGGGTHPYAAGIQEVEDWVADHWYTRAHSESVEAKLDALTEPKKAK